MEKHFTTDSLCIFAHVFSKEGRKYGRSRNKNRHWRFSLNVRTSWECGIAGLAMTAGIYSAEEWMKALKSESESSENALRIISSAVAFGSGAVRCSPERGMWRCDCKFTETGNTVTLALLVSTPVKVQRRTFNHLLYRKGVGFRRFYFAHMSNKASSKERISGFFRWFRMYLLKGPGPFLSSIFI